MIIPDANLLIYAYDSKSPHHQKAKKWWEGTLSGTENVGIPWIVVLAFTRLMSHPQICHNPLSTETIREIVCHWTSFAHLRLLNPSQDAVETYFDLLADAQMGGNLSTDAFIALHAREYSATVYTSDRDFERFQGIRTVYPLLRNLQ